MKLRSLAVAFLLAVISVSLSFTPLWAASETIDPELQVLTPGAGQTLEPGSKIPITWTYAHSDIVSTSLYFSSDAGLAWAKIATRTGNSGSYTWTVPDIQTDRGQVKVVCSRLEYAMGFIPYTVKSYYNVSGTFRIASPASTAEQSGSNTPELSSPAAPSNLSARALSSNSIQLTWTDNASNETGFSVQRSLQNSSGFTTVATAAANATSYTDTSLNAGTAYYYRVIAFNDAGTSDPSNTASAATLAESSPATNTSATETNTSTTSTSASANTNTAATGASSSASTVTATIPAAPLELRAMAVSSSSIYLTWADNSANETGFYVQRKTGSALNFNTIATLNANTTSYTDTGLAGDTTYYYRVVSFNDAGSSPGSMVSATTLESQTNANTLAGSDDSDFPAATKAPAAPSGLSGNSMSTTSVYLSWKDNSDNELGFIIESADNNGDFYVLDILPANSTSYTDTGLRLGTTCVYRVCAYNVAGISSYSNTVSVTVGTATQTVTSADPAASSAAASAASAQPQATGAESGNLKQVSAENSVHSASSAEPVIMRFFVGSKHYYQNAALGTMDAAPVIKKGRLLLPIGYIARPLGATAVWNSTEKKAIIALGSNIVEVTLNKNTAYVNGVKKFIDKTTPSLTPILVPPGRVMLPLRFIAESLGCQVAWKASTREAVVTYPKH